MQNTSPQIPLLLLVGLLLTGAACTPNSNNEQTKTNATDSLTMIQTSDGKWGIVDSQKTTLYEVFFYDNGPTIPPKG
ncbi:MAG: hypothetical protein R2822_15300 [Spirosomataceae bacterium]